MSQPSVSQPKFPHRSLYENVSACHACCGVDVSEVHLWVAVLLFARRLCQFPNSESAAFACLFLGFPVTVTTRTSAKMATRIIQKLQGDASSFVLLPSVFFFFETRCRLLKPTTAKAKCKKRLAGRNRSPFWLPLPLTKTLPTYAYSLRNAIQRATITRLALSFICGIFFGTGWVYIHRPEEANGGA